MITITDTILDIIVAPSVLTIEACTIESHTAKVDSELNIVSLDSRLLSIETFAPSLLSITYDVQENREIIPVTITGQTVFNLSHGYILVPNNIKVYIQPSGIKLIADIDYYLNGGNQIIITSTLFTLELGEILEIYYY